MKKHKMKNINKVIWFDAKKDSYDEEVKKVDLYTSFFEDYIKMANGFFKNIADAYCKATSDVVMEKTEFPLSKGFMAIFPPDSKTDEYVVLRERGCDGFIYYVCAYVYIDYDDEIALAYKICKKDPRTCEYYVHMGDSWKNVSSNID